MSQIEIDSLAQRKREASQRIVDADIRRMRCGMDPIPEEPRRFLHQAGYSINRASLERGTARMESVLEASRNLNALNEWLSEHAD